MKKKINLAAGPAIYGAVVPTTRPAASVNSFGPPVCKNSGMMPVFGRTVRWALLALAIGGVAGMLSGCFSVHVDRETDHPVVVTPAQPAQ